MSTTLPYIVEEPGNDDTPARIVDAPSKAAVRNYLLKDVTIRPASARELAALMRQGEVKIEQAG